MGILGTANLLSSQMIRTIPRPAENAVDFSSRSYDLNGTFIAASNEDLRISYFKLLLGCVWENARW